MMYSSTGTSLSSRTLVPGIVEASVHQKIIGDFIQKPPSWCAHLAYTQKESRNFKIREEYMSKSERHTQSEAV
jgi:hypothetical protein